MSARHPVTSLANSYLNTFTELLHSCKPEKAIAKFSKLVSGKQLDAMSANALFYVTHNASAENLKEDLISKACQAKLQLDNCAKGLSNFALRKLRGKAVVVHPLDFFSASVLHSASSVRFIQANQGILHLLPVHKLESHNVLTAHASMAGADMVLLEPTAVSDMGVFTASGGRLLAELAKARDIPVYALATSWHTAPNRPAQQGEERVPQDLITGIISEQGIFSHEEFLDRVQKDFPWML
jgi:hypothetical protein